LTDGRRGPIFHFKTFSNCHSILEKTGSATGSTAMFLSLLNRRRQEAFETMTFFKFKLYIAGQSPRSRSAIQNIQKPFDISELSVKLRSLLDPK
jgi:hypothetical protein